MLTKRLSSTSALTGTQNILTGREQPTVKITTIANTAVSRNGVMKGSGEVNYVSQLQLHARTIKAKLLAIVGGKSCPFKPDNFQLRQE